MNLLLALGLAAALAVPARPLAVAPDSGSVAFISTTFWLRTAPSLDAERLALLPEGTQVRVIECAYQACNVAFRNLEGYLPEEILDREGPEQPIDFGRGYVNSHGQLIPSPAWTVDDQAPTGATAPCSDGSYSFSQSAQGTCSSHGGVDEWLR
jgi:hypothetical protein